MIDKCEVEREERRLERATYLDASGLDVSVEVFNAVDAHMGVVAQEDVEMLPCRPTARSARTAFAKHIGEDGHFAVFDVGHTSLVGLKDLHRVGLDYELIDGAVVVVILKIVNFR